MIHRVAEVGFGTDPDRYERGRPGYPPDVVTSIMEFADLGQKDRILDLAAGTGKLTRMLIDGHHVVAVEPVAAMRAFLAERLPSITVVAGEAEALPFADACFRLVTVAQAFHWFDAPRAWGELARVVAPGGTVALVWNARDRTVGWVDSIWTIMDRVEKHAPWRNHDRAQRFDTKGAFHPPVEVVVRHEVSSSVQRIVDRLMSVSHIAVLPPTERRAIADEIRRTLATHPDTAGRGELVIPYRTDLYLFRRS